MLNPASRCNHRSILKPNLKSISRNCKLRKGRNRPSFRAENNTIPSNVPYARSQIHSPLPVLTEYFHRATTPEDIRSIVTVGEFHIDNLMSSGVGSNSSGIGEGL